MTDPRKVATDAAYVAVGLGVIAFQQLASRRDEIDELCRSVGERVGERVAPAVEEIRRRAPEVVELLRGAPTSR